MLTPREAWRRLRTPSHERAATAPLDFVNSGAWGDFGPGVGHQPSHETLLRESLGVAARATRAIANRLASLNPQVVRSVEVEPGTVVDEVIDDHALKRLLDRPHPNLSWFQLMQLTSSHLVTVGEGYWLKVGSRMGVPMQLHSMPPENVAPIVRAGVIEGYRVNTRRGQVEILRPDVVVRFNIPDPENMWGSEGYLAPGGITADSLKFTGQHLRSHYEHDAIPKTVLKAIEAAGAAAPTPEARERFELAWKQRYHGRGGTNQGVPAMLPMGWDIIQMAMQSGADVTPLLEFWRDEQLMDFGTPRSVLGQVVSGDRSSAETNQYVFDLHTVTPLATLITDALTLQLAPDFDAGVVVRFEPFVSDDKSFGLEQEKSDLDRKVRSPNEVREARGEDPATWGDLPIGTIADVPYTGDEFDSGDLGMPSPFMPQADDDDDDEEPEEDEDRSRAPDAYALEEWARQIGREKAFVPAMLKAMRRLFNGQRDRVIEKYAAIVPLSRVSVQDIFDDVLEIWALEIAPLRAQAVGTIAEQTLLALGAEGAFLFNERVVAFLQSQGADLVRGVNHTTRKALARELAAAAAAGLGVDDTAKAIRGVFATASKRRARVIARTEILKASQFAQTESFRQSGLVERKRWNTSLDAKVRDTHEPVNGQVRALNEPFTLGDGEQADAPGLGHGGGRLSPHNAINCRCFLTPVFEGE